MRMVATHTHSKQVRRLAGASAVVAIAAGSVHACIPSALAPRINVRWAAPITEEQRRIAERTLHLLEGAPVDGPTWAYDLGDLSPAAVESLVTHPSVDDTHHIDRARRRVSADAPAGRTRILSGLSLVHDSKLLGWVESGSFAVLLVSLTWLMTTGRRAPEEDAG